MELTFLGTGTSTGVPEIGCTCPVCTSLDPADHRLRCSALLTEGDRCILIDCGPDIRTQLLTADSPNVQAMLVTHSHYDHVGGLIDLRAYCRHRNFPIYCNSTSARNIRACFPYCFVDNLYPGVPTFDIHVVKAFEKFNVEGFDIEALPVMHGGMEILGYKIGKLAYITDCKTMPQSTISALKGIDTLVINALRIKPHHSHMSLDETLAVVREIAPRRTYLIHMSHGIGRHADVDLPSGITLARDFMQISI